MDAVDFNYSCSLASDVAKFRGESSPSASVVALFDEATNCRFGCFDCNWAVECPRIFGQCALLSSCIADIEANTSGIPESVYGNFKACGLRQCREGEASIPQKKLG